MPTQHSVSQWIASLKAGDLVAVQKLWDRYRRQLVERAKSELACAPKQVADEEDVAQNVFFSLCRGASSGRLNDVRNRDDLWWLLLAMTQQKSIDLIRRETAQKRGGGRVCSESALLGSGDENNGPSLDLLLGTAPTPDTLAILEEENRRLMGLLRDDQLRRIAVSRIEGYSIVEIAAELTLSTRSIERKLQLIRNAWTKELIHAERLASAD